MSNINIVNDLKELYDKHSNPMHCGTNNPDTWVLVDLIERTSRAEAELARIKDGGGWYEDTPGGVRKFCTVNEEQEVKTATEQVNILRKLCGAMLEALIIVNNQLLEFKTETDDVGRACYLAELIIPHAQEVLNG